MRSFGRPRRALAALTATLALVPVGAAGWRGWGAADSGDPVVAAEARSTAPATPRALATVTLVTGDRVTLRSVAGRVAPDVQPAPGREHVGFDAYEVDDHIHVVPSDAGPLLAARRLDRRLFDVTTLVDSGYDDAHRPDIPLIAVHGDGDGGDPGARTADSTVAAAGAQVTPLPAADAVAVAQPKASTADLWAQLTAATGAEARDADDPGALAAGVEALWLDGLRQPSLDVSVPQIGAPEAWAAGFTGAGVTVAVLDTGVDVTHPDLAGKVTASRNFTGEPDDDLVGHGTHVASTIVGSGAGSGGRHRGVAPDASLLSGKVCFVSGCPDSAIIAALQWAVDSGARVVNLSLGGADTPEVDPLETAVDQVSAQHGTLVVVAAGNEGPHAGTVASPASAEAALAVGAVDDGDRMAPFSSRGPRVADGALKPEITAPGVGIVAARARHGSVGEPAGDGYASLSGTSMATPHVVGAAALLAQQHPDWAGTQLRASLIGSARPADGTAVYDQGAGRVDVARAVHQEVVAEPAVVSAGRPAWPHDDDQPLTRTVTYRNPGAGPVTLSLAVQTRGPEGAPAPEGMFTLSAPEVTVPAGGEAGVDVTVDTRAPSPTGGYGAWIVARGPAGPDQAVVTTPVAVEEEPESYDLTIEHRDGGGSLTALYLTVVRSLDGPGLRFPYDPDGSVTLRLARGGYHVDTTIETRGDQSFDAKLVQPRLDLDQDTTLVLDARQAQPLDIEVRHEGVALTRAFMSYVRASSSGQRLHHWAELPDLTSVRTAQVGPSVGPDEMITELQTSWGVPGPDGRLLTSPRTYNLAWYERGGMFTGASHVVRDGSLTRIRSQFGTTGPGRMATRSVYPNPPGRSPLLGLGHRVALPLRRVELYNTEGVEWTTELTEVRLDDPTEPLGFAIDETILEANQPVGEPGTPGRERWNAAPLGPLVSHGAGDVCSADWTGPAAGRRGDVITVDLPLFSDAAGHPGCAGEVEGRTTLLRDGVVVGETDTPGRAELTVPAADGGYRLEVDAMRPEAELSTRVSAAWTFRSAHGDGDDPEPLPLMAARFAPRLDEQGRAPGGQRFAVPLTLDTLGGAGGEAGPGLPTVEVSYDDGTTWAPAPVRREGGSYRAILHHPAGGTVSLRAAVTDSSGNQVEQTIVGAYHLAPPG